MAKTKIVILGAGISGLTLAFYLERYRDDVEITLLEREERVGGWIRSEKIDGYLFERGPRSIRTAGKTEATIQLVRALGLDGEVIAPSQVAKRRYLWHDGALRELPSGPGGFLTSSLLHGLKWKIVRESRVKKGEAEDESIFSFFARRFGERLTERLVDPVISGIFAGNPRQLSIRSCLPTMWEAEQKEGSLIRGMRKRKKSPKTDPLQKLKMFSFKEGIERLPKALKRKIRSEIILGCGVEKLEKKGDKINVVTDQGTYTCDEVYSTLSAQTLAKLVEEEVPEASWRLVKVPLSTVATVSIAYPKEVLKQKGFGYLVPSKERENVMGCVFDSSIFPQQDSTKHQTRLTVMMGGAHRPDLLELPDLQLAKLAQEDLEKHLGLRERPFNVSVNRAVNAIPQYPVGHAITIEEAHALLADQMPGLKALGTSFHGVSLNDCIHHAKKAAKLSLT